MYVVVEFSDGVMMVPTSWIKDGKCFWPNKIKKQKLEEMIRKRVEPEEHWPQYKIIRNFCKSGIFYFLLE